MWGHQMQQIGARIPGQLRQNSLFPYQVGRRGTYPGNYSRFDFWQPGWRWTWQCQDRLNLIWDLGKDGQEVRRGWAIGLVKDGPAIIQDAERINQI
jgi:hypothetical protein